MSDDDDAEDQREGARVTINKEFESFDAFIHEYVTNISRTGAFDLAINGWTMASLSDATSPPTSPAKGGRLNEVRDRCLGPHPSSLNHEPASTRVRYSLRCYVRT